MKQREMQKLVTVGEVSVDRATYDRLEAAAAKQDKSVNLVADEAINRDLDSAGGGTLASELVRLSELVRDCYDVALNSGNKEVASELVLIAHAVAAMIPRALKQEIKQ